jgi:flavin-dependent dehydrogenase
VVAAAEDPLKALRDPERFTRVVQGLPAAAHWLDGTPITEVLPIAGKLDRYRRFVIDSTPVATGFAAVGDAWACTNPSAGRGLSMGLIHAQLLRTVIRHDLDDPAAFARGWDEYADRC